MNEHSPLQRLALGSRLPNPQDEVECSNCGERIRRCMLDWPEYRFDSETNIAGEGYDEYCPNCGKLNTFEEIT